MIRWKPVYTYIFNSLGHPSPILNILIETQVLKHSAPSDIFSFELGTIEYYKYLMFINVFMKLQ